MDGIRYWLEAEGTGHVFFMAYPVCLLLLFFLLKGRRISFLLPGLLMTLVIVNPLFYQLWDRLGLYAYWRILWIVPVIPVIAAVIPGIAEKCSKEWIKGITVLVGAALIIAGGTFLYSGAGGSFTATTDNITKLPKPVIEVAERLLTLKDNPRIIAEAGISVYIRQYTGKIDTLFGRNIFGYMDGYKSDAQEAIAELENPGSDLGNLGQYMLDNGYDYLVIGEQSHKEQMKDHFELVEQVGAYCIYRAIGTAQLIKERNELGQIVSVTTVNPDGEPENCEYGYASICYEYDGNGNVTETRFADADGEGAADRYGTVIYQRAYNKIGQLVSERCVYKDGTEEKRTYEAGKITSIKYQDKEGNPSKQPAGHYGMSLEWKEGMPVSRTYLDQKGLPANRTDGYAQVQWIDNYVKIFNREGIPISADGINLYVEGETDEDGWTEWITPRQNVVNWCVDLTSVVLDEKRAGDQYTCQIEIEFRNISSSNDQAFYFRTQGVVDGRYDIGNMWNDVIMLYQPPLDGVYRFTRTMTIDEPMSQAKGFGIGFRCDNWASGSFRVRRIKIEKGPAASEWTPGI